MSIIEEKNHHRKDNNHSKDSPKVDGTWSEFLERSERKRGRLGVPSVKEKKGLHGHTLHFVPSMPIGFAMVN